MLDAVAVSTGTRKIKARTESKERTGTHQSRKRRKGKATANQVRIASINIGNVQVAAHGFQRNVPCFLERSEIRAVSSSLHLIVYILYMWAAL